LSRRPRFCFFPPQAFGAKRAVAVYLGCVAVGLSSGVTLVLMPRTIAADGTATGPPKVVQLGEPRGLPAAVDAGGAAAVTCLAFNAGCTLLAAGHAGGDVALWEFRRGGSWECVKARRGDRQTDRPQD
jgi:hypothetical protein